MKKLIHAHTNTHEDREKEKEKKTGSKGYGYGNFGYWTNISKNSFEIDRHRDNALWNQRWKRDEITNVQFHFEFQLHLVFGAW